MGHHPVQDHLTSTHRGCRHALLIDPVEQSPEIAADRAQTAVICGTQLILIGGSTDTSGGSVDATVRSIKERLELCKFADSQSIDGNEERWEVPIVLFPSGADSLSDEADGVLFMMLTVVIECPCRSLFVRPGYQFLFLGFTFLFFLFLCNCIFITRPKEYLTHVPDNVSLPWGGN